MPKTKQNNRTSPPVQLSAEDLKEVETILQDFDQQCDKFMADVAKDNETFLDSLANNAKLELFKWPKTSRKKKLGDIFPSADSEIWNNYDELESVALAGKSDPSSSTTDSLASSSVDNNALKDAMEEVAEIVASQVKRGIKSTRKKGAAAVARTKVNIRTIGTCYAILQILGDFEFELLLLIQSWGAICRGWERENLNHCISHNLFKLILSL